VTHHHLTAERASVHGPFNRDRTPVLLVDPGDTVTYTTLDAGWGRLGEETLNIPRRFVPDAATDVGHALTGPVYVRGARPGDALEIRIERLRPGGWGWTWGGPAQPFQRTIGIEDAVTMIWHIDVARGVATDAGGRGLTVPIRPFMGLMGNAPAAEGDQSTTPPRRVGGNIDCRELVAGSILWLPVEVDGALFSVGDGHATQGDGEIAQTALECPMDEVTLTFDVRRDRAIDAPCASTPAGFVTMGFGNTLDDATSSALSAMLDHLTGEQELTRSEALVLASLVVSVRVTQLVNGVVGIHAVLPPDAFIRLRDEGQ
jgi:acetamidase/formamidase